MIRPRRRCFDCEHPIKDGALCAICAWHRRHCRTPQPWAIYVTKLDNERGIMYCHGAGPNGLMTSRLGVKPEPIYK